MDKNLLNEYAAKAEKIHELLSYDQFFVCGAPKSGTTWFQRLLDTHPQVVCSGEGHFIETLMDPLGKMATMYNKRQAFSAQRVYEGKPYYQGLKYPEMEFVARTIIALVMLQRRIPDGTKCVGDKTPRYTLRMDLLSRIFPQAKFIHVVRDGRDVITSTCYHAYRAGHPAVVDNTRPDYFNYTAQCANIWVNNVNAAEEFGSKNKEKYLRVRYEDMLDKPKVTLTGMFEFLGVDTGASIMRKCIDKNEFKKVSGGRNNGDINNDSFYRSGTYGSWEKFLTNNALKTIYATAGDTLKAMGYQVEKQSDVSTSENKPRKTRKRRRA